MSAMGRLLLGSVTTGLIHHAHCPVAVIHSDENAAPDSNAPVLLGIDGSPASEAATALALMKPPAEGLSWCRYTHGVMWGCFRCSGWTGGTARLKGRRSSPNVSPAGRNSIRMCA